MSSGSLRVARTFLGGSRGYARDAVGKGRTQDEDCPFPWSDSFVTNVEIASENHPRSYPEVSRVNVSLTASVASESTGRA